MLNANSAHLSITGLVFSQSNWPLKSARGSSKEAALNLKHPIPNLGETVKSRIQHTDKSNNDNLIEARKYWRSSEIRVTFSGYYRSDILYYEALVMSWIKSKPIGGIKCCICDSIQQFAFNSSLTKRNTYFSPKYVSCQIHPHILAANIRAMENCSIRISYFTQRCFLLKKPLLGSYFYSRSATSFLGPFPTFTVMARISKFALTVVLQHNFITSDTLSVMKTRRILTRIDSLCKDNRD